MKDYQLTEEEKQILEDYNRGEFVSVASLDDRIKKTQKAAKNTLRKNKNINLRVTERDLRLLKVRAIEEGLPYQTLAASILHKYVTS